MIEVGESKDNGASPLTANDLKEIVQKYRVCYEVWPEWAIVAEKRLKIGFDRFLHIAPGPRHRRNDVVLTIRILHRHEFDVVAEHDVEVI